MTSIVNIQQREGEHMYKRQLLFNIVPISTISYAKPNPNRQVTLAKDTQVTVALRQENPASLVSAFVAQAETHQLPAASMLGEAERVQYSVQTSEETATLAAAALDAFRFGGTDLNELILDKTSKSYQAGIQSIQDRYDHAKLQLAQKGQKFSNVEVRYLNANGLFNAMNYTADDFPDIRVLSGGYDGSSNGLRSVDDAQQSFAFIPFLEGSGILRQTKVIDRLSGTGEQDINFVVYALSVNPLQQDPTNIVTNPLDPRGYTNKSG